MSQTYECFLLHSHVNALKEQGYDLTAGTVYRDLCHILSGHSASILIFRHRESSARRVQLLYCGVVLNVIEDLDDAHIMITNVVISTGESVCYKLNPGGARKYFIGDLKQMPVALAS